MLLALSLLVTSLHRRKKFEFPYYQLDSNQNFATRFESEAFDGVCLVEVTERLENPRHTFRQIKILLKKGRRRGVG